MIADVSNTTQEALFRQELIMETQRRINRSHAERKRTHPDTTPTHAPLEINGQLNAQTIEAFVRMHNTTHATALTFAKGRWMLTEEIDARLESLLPQHTLAPGSFERSRAFAS